jgi:hypothetical protein
MIFWWDFNHQKLGVMILNNSYFLRWVDRDRATALILENDVIVGKLGLYNYII